MFFPFTTGLALLFSCASANRDIVHEYRRFDFSGSQLAIVLPDIDDFIIGNPEDVLDDLDSAGTGNFRQVFSDFFQHHFVSAMRQYSCFQNIRWFHKPSDLPTDYKTYILGRNKQVSFTLPSKNYRFPVDTACRFVLLLNPAEISRYRGSEGHYIQDSDQQDIYKTADPQRFRLYTEYVFWDNDESRAVAFGIINIERGIFISLTRKDWINILYQMSWEILRGSALQKTGKNFF